MNTILNHPILLQNKYQTKRPYEVELLVGLIITLMIVFAIFQLTISVLQGLNTSSSLEQENLPSQTRTV